MRFIHEITPITNSFEGWHRNFKKNETSRQKIARCVHFGKKENENFPLNLFQSLSSRMIAPKRSEKEEQIREIVRHTIFEVFGFFICYKKA